MDERLTELERLDYWLKCEGGLAPESSNHLLIRSPGIYAPGAPVPTLGDLRWLVAEVRRLQRDLQTIVASASHVGLGKTPGEIADRIIRANSAIIDQQETIDELRDRLAATESLNLGLAERVHKQSELLSRKAELLATAEPEEES